MPARYETLGNFLDICLGPDSEPERIAHAVELDPGILGAFLSLRQNSRTPAREWYRDIDPAFFPALGIAMAHEYVIDMPVDHGNQTQNANWRRSVLQSLLADQIAIQFDSVDGKEARLAALLTRLGPMLVARLDQGQEESLDHMVQRTEEGQAELTADLVASWGYEAPFCDAIRYHPIELGKLGDASHLIKVVAAAGRLEPFVEGPELLTPNLAHEIQSLLGLNEDSLYEIIGQVSREFDDIKAVLHMEAPTDDLTPKDQTPPANVGDSKAWCRFKYHLNNWTLTAIFHNALSHANPQTPFESLVRDTGRALFAFNWIVHMQPEGEHLQGIVGEDEKITVMKSSSQSHVAKCYRENNDDTLSDNDIASVTDRQLLHRSNSDVLMCISLGDKAGVLVCGVDNDVPAKLENRSHLLSSYAEAISHTWELRQSRSQPDIDVIKQRLREISHEANNPLSIVQNYLRTLSLKLEDNAAAQSDIQAISNEIMRSSDIIRKFAQIDVDGTSSAGELDINATIQQLVDVFSGGYEDLIFKLDFDAARPTTVIPANDLKQVLVNLIKNAAEALSVDTRIIDRGKQIMVSTCGSINLGGHPYIEIAVSDNGPGIPHKIREKLFQPHVSNKDGHHSGLGLSIARQLVESLGGVISCKSRVEEEGTPGTSFQVLIPKISNNDN